MRQVRTTSVPESASEGGKRAAEVDAAVGDEEQREGPDEGLKTVNLLHGG